MSFSLSRSNNVPNGHFISPQKNGFDSEKTPSSLDFETDLNLLSKYGYTTSAQTIKGNPASLSWELPEAEADFIAFMTSLPPQRNNCANNNGVQGGLKELGFGFLDNNDAEGEITDEYGVCSIINNEQFNPEVILHEFDEDLLQGDDSQEDNGLSRHSQAPFMNRIPFESKLLNLRTSSKPYLLKSEENVGFEAEVPRLEAAKEIQMSSSAPTTVLNGTEEMRSTKVRVSKRTSQAAKNQPKVRMSLAQFLTVTGEETNDEQYEPEEEEEVSNVLWVGNIGPDVREEELREDFGAFGPINDIKILRESFCAFINFQEIANAVNAKRELNGEIFGTQYIVIKYRKANQKYLNATTTAVNINGVAMGSSPSFGQAPSIPVTKPPPDTTGNRIVTNPACSSLWVGNLSDDVTKSELFEEFSRFGLIESIRMLSHCAFINFTTVEHATAALVAMQAKQLGQLNIKINYGRARHPTIPSSSFDEDEFKREELMLAGLNLSSSPSVLQQQFQTSNRAVPKTHNFLTSSTGSISNSPQLSTSPIGLMQSRSPPPPLLSQQVTQAEIDPFLHPYPYSSLSTQSTSSPASNYMFYKPSTQMDSSPSSFDDDLLVAQQQLQLQQIQQQIHQTHHLHHQLQSNTNLQTQLQKQSQPTKQQMYTLFNNNSNSHVPYPFQSVNQPQLPYQSQVAQSQHQQHQQHQHQHQQHQHQLQLQLQLQKQTLSQSLPTQYPSTYSTQQFTPPQHLQYQHRTQTPPSQVPFQSSAQPQHHFQAPPVQQRQQFSQPQQIIPQRSPFSITSASQQPAYHQMFSSQSYDSAYNNNNISEGLDSGCLLCSSGEVADAIFLPCNHRSCSKCVTKLRFTKERKCPFCSEFVVKVLSTAAGLTSASPIGGYE